MTADAKKKLLTTNTIYWIAAMAVPIILDFGLKAFATGPATFPWTITIPFFFVGLLLASNKLIMAAIACSANVASSQADVGS